MIDRGRVGSGCFESAFDCNTTEFLSADGLEQATSFSIATLTANPFTKRGAGTAYNHNIFCHEPASPNRVMNLTVTTTGA